MLLSLTKASVIVRGHGNAIVFHGLVACDLEHKQAKNSTHSCQCWEDLSINQMMFVLNPIIINSTNKLINHREVIE